MADLYLSLIRRSKREFIPATSIRITSPSMATPSMWASVGEIQPKTAGPRIIPVSTSPPGRGIQNSGRFHRRPWRIGTKPSVLVGTPLNRAPRPLCRLLLFSRFGDKGSPLLPLDVPRSYTHVRDFYCAARYFSNIARRTTMNNGHPGFIELVFRPFQLVENVA